MISQLQTKELTIQIVIFEIEIGMLSDSRWIFIDR